MLETLNAVPHNPQFGNAGHTGNDLPGVDAPGFPGPVGGHLAAMLSSFMNPGNARHGDAVYTQEALDHIVSQLMEQHTASSAPPPASEEAINNLPTKKVEKSMLGDDGKADCSICMDSVEIGTEVVELPCSHWFHRQCIAAWLISNDSCPHCRKGIMPENGGSQQAGNQGTNASPATDSTRQANQSTQPQTPRTPTNPQQQAGGRFGWGTAGPNIMPNMPGVRMGPAQVAHGQIPGGGAWSIMNIGGPPGAFPGAMPGDFPGVFPGAMPGGFNFGTNAQNPPNPPTVPPHPQTPSQGGTRGFGSESSDARPRSERRSGSGGSGGSGRSDGNSGGGISERVRSWFGGGSSNN
jgi:E3 ubiquitin-protein ligase RNF115/126